MSPATVSTPGSEARYDATSTAGASVPGIAAGGALTGCLRRIRGWNPRLTSCCTAARPTLPVAPTTAIFAGGAATAAAHAIKETSIASNLCNRGLRRAPRKEQVEKPTYVEGCTDILLDTQVTAVTRSRRTRRSIDTTHETCGVCVCVCVCACAVALTSVKCEASRATLHTHTRRGLPLGTDILLAARPPHTLTPFKSP